MDIFSFLINGTGLEGAAQCIQNKIHSVLAVYPLSGRPSRVHPPLLLSGSRTKPWRPRFPEGSLQLVAATHAPCAPSGRSPQVVLAVVPRWGRRRSAATET